MTIVRKRNSSPNLLTVKVYISGHYTFNSGILLFLLYSLTSASTLMADNADVIEANIEVSSGNRYSFFVTVKHEDTGWDHYVDRWEVLAPDEQIIAVRVLRHPHIQDQPFARPLRYIEIPESINQVKIRAHCSRDGYAGKTLEKQLPGRN